MSGKAIFGTALAVLLLIVLSQNAQVVTLRFLLWKFSASQIILTLFTLLIGFAVGFIVAKAGRRRRRSF